MRHMPFSDARSQQGNEKVLVGQIRSQFKANMREVDDGKINEQKEA